MPGDGHKYLWSFTGEAVPVRLAAAHHYDSLVFSS